MSAFIDELVQADLPIMGVCLGLEAIVEHFGGKLACFDSPMHGKKSIAHNFQRDPVFKQLPASFHVGHYHSFYADPEHFPDSELEVLVTVSAGDGNDSTLPAGVDIPMAVRHRRLPIMATQYHPESIMDGSNTNLLELMLKHLTDLAAQRIRQRAVAEARKLQRVLFTVAGYPSEEGFVDVLLGLQDSGEVDIVEVDSAVVTDPSHPCRLAFRSMTRSRMVR
jgi:anthranilate/para-aminobenzoate synthase component II